MKEKTPSGLVKNFLCFILWGWIPVAKNLLWFRSLDRKARKLLASSDSKKRGMGRSIVMFLCEHIFWELSYLHKRGGWLANRHLELIDYAVSISLKKGDVEKESIENWRTRCYETVGFLNDGRAFSSPNKPKKLSRKSKPETPVVKSKPIVINEMIEV